MLSDAELWRAFTPSGVFMDATFANLRAVEAAVRADQAVECNNARFDLLRKLETAGQRYAEVVSLANQATRDLAAAQAVIAEVRAYLDEGKGAYPPDLYGILSQSPTDALQAHDRQVAAKALTDVRDELRRWAETNRPYTNMAQIAGVREASNIVGRRAAAIVSEPSTPEQEGRP